MDHVINLINERCPVDLTRVAIRAYLDVRIFTGDTIPDPEVTFDSDRALRIDWWVDGTVFQVRVDLDAGLRERPDQEVYYTYDDFKGDCGLGYSEAAGNVWKHLADMYPEFAATLGEDFFEGA